MRCKKSMHVVIIFFVFLFVGCMDSERNIQSNKQDLQQEQPKFNYLTKQEKENGWKLLFDGKTLNGWKGVNPIANKDENWKVNDGVLSPNLSDNETHQDLITEEQFDVFELSLAFKIFKGTNSGIKYLVTRNFPERKGTYLGFEYQILDNSHVKYEKRGEYRSLASLYDLIGAKNEDEGVSLSDQWHHARIIVNQDDVEHWLDGHKVVQYKKGSAKFRSLIADSKYNIYKGFGTSDAGHILLQNEGTPIAFRNIKIKGGL